MKTFLIIMLFLFVIIIIGIFVYLLTFDANRYKDLLVGKIEGAIGKEVKMGGISLIFFPGLALRIEELSIKDTDKTWGDAILDAESINVGIKLLPLMKKDIQVHHLNIKKLNMNITRDFSSTIKIVFSDIESKGAMKKDNIVIQRLTGFVAGGYFSAKGILKDKSSSQYLDFDVTLKDIDIPELLADVSRNRLQLEGRLSMNLQSTARGLDGQKILDTLSGSGTAKMDKAVLKNINVLNIALDKLNSILPELVGRLKERLPQRYSGLLRQDFTAFRPTQTVFNIEKGKIFFKKTIVESDAFYIIGSGYVGIGGDLEINANLFIPKDLSSAFIGEVYELKYLENSEGMITMPIYINGRIPNLSVKPDLDYVMERLAVATGEELLRSIFRKQKSPEAPQDEADNEGVEKEGEKAKPAEILIRTIFDIIAGPENKQGGGQ